MNESQEHSHRGAKVELFLLFFARTTQTSPQPMALPVTGCVELNKDS